MPRAARRPFSEPRWTPDQARAELDDFQRSGLSRQKWCSQRGVSLTRLRYWSEKLQTRAREGQPKPPELISLTLKRPDRPDQSQSPLELHVAGGYRVTLRSGFDEETLERLLAVLEC